MKSLLGLAALLCGLVLLTQAARLLLFFYSLGVVLFWVFAGLVGLWILSSATRRRWSLDILSGIFLSW